MPFPSPKEITMKALATSLAVAALLCVSVMIQSVLADHQLVLRRSVRWMSLYRSPVPGFERHVPEQRPDVRSNSRRHG